jgi:hypothetical protein
VSECDHESPIMRRPWPIGGLLLHDKRNASIFKDRRYSFWGTLKDGTYVHKARPLKERKNNAQRENENRFVVC